MSDVELTEAERMDLLCGEPDCIECRETEAACLRILAARLTQEREQVRAEGAAIVESFRRQNPMNGDGSNYTIDLILATLVGPEERDRLRREHQDKWNAEYLAMCDRFAAQDGPRQAQGGEQ